MTTPAIRLLLATCTCLVPLAAEDAVVVERAPRPLPASATTADWSHLLGPTWNLHTSERLHGHWDSGGPPRCWQVAKGASYATPIIVAGKVLAYHRQGDEDLLDCRALTTGALLWRDRRPTNYRDRFGYHGGPRGSPTCDGEVVVTLSAEAELRCVTLADGAPRWTIALAERFELPRPYFGYGHSPLLHEGQVIVVVGAVAVPTVLALRLDDGTEVWRWQGPAGPSYASPVPCGEQGVAVFTGGPGRPPRGGVALLDLRDGQLRWRREWRSSIVHSVNAASPLVLDDQVVVTASYGTGALSCARSDGGIRWRSAALGAHWGTPIAVDGLIIGIDGRHAGEATLVALDAATGVERWRTATLPGTEVPIGRASLLRAVDAVWCLTETGHLAELVVDGAGMRTIGHRQVFDAAETWTGLAVSRGLLMVSKNGRDADGEPAWMCFDVRP